MAFRAIIAVLLLTTGVVSTNAVQIGENRDFESSSPFYCIDLDGTVGDCPSSGADESFAANDQLVAHVRYHNRINHTGWAELDLTTASGHSDHRQAYFAGFLEGRLTARLIDSLRANIDIGEQGNRSAPLCAQFADFIDENLEWTRTKIRENPEDNYWRQIGLVLYQLAGLDDGYWAAKRKHSDQESIPPVPHTKLNPCSSIFINLIGEFPDLAHIISGGNGKVFNPAPTKRVDHCSALVKWIPALGEVFVSQNTWTMFDQMLRILKRYNLHYSGVRVHSVAMSSYPGLVFSVDDFYVTSAQLVVQETSIACFNVSMFHGLTARNLQFEFIRNTVANRLAESGPEWAKIFGRLNSGTYNNQFMVVDYKRLADHGRRLEDNFLVVLEQMPNLLVHRDETDRVRRTSFWPSYNIPYYPEVYEKSGYADRYRKYGDYYSYNNTARARIFARDHHKVDGLKQMYRLMRYNDFRHDPLSLCLDCDPQPNSFYSIASRGDQNDPTGKYPEQDLGQWLMGAIDAKITSARMIKRLEMLAISGPTAEQEPVFDWRRVPKSAANQAHRDQPEVWDFKPVKTRWSAGRPFEEFRFEEEEEDF